MKGVRYKADRMGSICEWTIRYQFFQSRARAIERKAEMEKLKRNGAKQCEEVACAGVK